MKCNKCGEECKENQAFCLKCGNPIQVVPDFNLIEAELASNIGELMEEIDKESDIKEEQTVSDEIEIKEVQANDMELKLVDISRRAANEQADGKTKIIGDINSLIADEAGQEKGSEEPGVMKKQETKTAADYQKDKKNNKKKTAIIVSSIVAALAVIIIVFVIIAQSIDKTATSYDEYYNSAKSAYEKMNTDDALKDAKNALDKATNNNEKLEARRLIYDIHVLAGVDDEEYADNLEQIVMIGTKSSKYYLALAEYYNDNGKYTNLTDLIRSIDDEEIIEALSDYVVKEPTADFESGDYNTYMAVTLTCEDGYKIYYTTDSRNPSNYGEEYKEPVQITEEGEFIIKAITVNENGVESKIATYTYIIALTGSNAPKVTPSGGAYNEYTKIKIEVPEGAKAYYTWDGTKPTEESEEYVEEIDMKRGINVLKVVIIDKYGIASEVSTESYNLQIPRAITLNDSVQLIQDEAEKELEEEETLSVKYEDTVVIGNDEYYIISVTTNDSEGSAKSVTVYAVNTYDKSIHKAIDEEGQYSIEKETEEETTE